MSELKTWLQWRDWVQLHIAKLETTDTYEMRSAIMGDMAETIETAVRASDARIAELEAEVERLRAQSETMRNILQEADKRIVWEHNGLGHDFTDRVEDALND
jgi:hypothetical protein